MTDRLDDDADVSTESEVDDVTDSDSDSGAESATDAEDASASVGSDDEPAPGSAEEVLTSTISTLELVTSERDEYLDLARRVQADFENYRRRVEGQRAEQVQRAAEALVVELLPVLDACEAALGHGADDVVPIHAALVGTLEKRGLSRVDEVDVPFDPSVHEAVLTEPDSNGGDPTVAEVMRTGYSWNGRVVRPAMVKVRG